MDAVFFCAGPGSTLGLRLTLAFIKTVQWEKKTGLSLFSYNALDLAARMSPQKPAFIQAPFRMGWRFVRSKEEDSFIGKKQILNTDDALKNYPDSLHLPDPRKKTLEIDPNKILKYEIKKVNGEVLKFGNPGDNLKVTLKIKDERLMYNLIKNGSVGLSLIHI